MNPCDTDENPLDSSQGARQTETELTRDYLAEPGRREELTRLVPADRLGTPEDVVGAVLFLASPRASFVTGQVLYIDGGRTLV
ncbi:SDR family NAD(P)-dependent oxidoreductase [Nonomuraea sp. NPDC002799]